MQTNNSIQLIHAAHQEISQDVLAVDVGYGYTKAISTSGRRVIFPSVIAPAWDLPLSNMVKEKVGYNVSIRRSHNDQEEVWFVGDLALREGQEVQYTLDRVKHAHPSHDVLLLTAAALTTIPTRVNTPDGITGPTLVVGLPVDCYRDTEHRNSLRKHLENLKATVSVDGSEPARVNFRPGNVMVYPQGAGALLTADNLPEEGIVALIDVGYKTTDCVAVELGGGNQKLMQAMCTSCNKGIIALLEAVTEEFHEHTKAQLPLRYAIDALRTSRVWYRGEKVDLSGTISKARREVSRAIADQVLAKWGERADFVRGVYLSGGGALELTELPQMFPATKILDDAQWSNAIGFLEVGKTKR
ncbi:MAG: ParM/StbA family protein [Bacillota bacterium]